MGRCACSDDHVLPTMRRTRAREELRLQAGTLRFDVNALASKLDRASAKNVAALKSTAYKKVRPLPYCDAQLPCPSG